MYNLLKKCIVMINVNVIGRIGANAENPLMEKSLLHSVSHTKWRDEAGKI